MPPSSPAMKNGELGDTVTDYFKNQDGQKGSAITFMAARAGELIHVIRMSEIMIMFLMIMLLLVPCSESVAATPRALNKMNMMLQPRILVAEDARGPVTPSGPSGCTKIPGMGGKCVGKHG